MKNSIRSRLLPVISLALTIIGLLGSLVMMIHTGRHNRSIILILAFTGWVSSPFLALLITYFSNRWPDSRRKYLYILMIVIAFISLIVYSGSFGIHGPHPAFVFMIIPLLSWILIGLMWVTVLKLKN